MKNLVILVVMVCLLAGCATTVTPFGTTSGLGIGGGEMAKYADPTKKVDPSQTAYKGADSHAAALALGDIQDPAARADAKEALIAVSENTGWGGTFGRGRGVRSGVAPTIAGTNGGYGRLYNPFEYPIMVQIRGLGSPYTFGPGEEQELLVPYGKYDIVVYNAESGQLIGHDQIDTSHQTKVGDKVYDFNVRLDGTDIR